MLVGKQIRQREIKASGRRRANYDPGWRLGVQLQKITSHFVRLDRALFALPADSGSPPPTFCYPLPILSGYRACSQLQAIKLSNIVRLISADGMSLIPASAALGRMALDGRKREREREAISHDLWPLLGSSICLCPGQEKVPTNERPFDQKWTLAFLFLFLAKCQPSLPRNSALERFSVANNRHEIVVVAVQTNDASDRERLALIEQLNNE